MLPVFVSVNLFPFINHSIVADNSDFGILRVIVSEPQRALQVLKEHRFAVSLTNVICLRTSNILGPAFS